MVITIIGLLLALLLSALRKARQSAQALLCMSQEKQIGLMVATYIHNHTTGIIPPVQDLELVHRTVYQMWTGILIEEILDYSATEQNRRIIKSQADGDNAFPIFYCPTMVEEGFTGNSTLPPGWHQNYLANWDIFVIYEREFPRRIDKFLEQNRTAIMMDTKGSVLGPLGGSGITFHNKNHITPAFRPR